MAPPLYATHPPFLIFLSLFLEFCSCIRVCLPFLSNFLSSVSRYLLSKSISDNILTSPFVQMDKGASCELCKEMYCPPCAVLGPMKNPCSSGAKHKIDLPDSSMVCGRGRRRRRKILKERVKDMENDFVSFNSASFSSLMNKMSLSCSSKVDSTFLF